MELGNIIFDLDGALVDSLAGLEYSVNRAFEKQGYAPRTSGLRTLIGPPIRHILGEISGEERAQKLDGLDAAFRESYDMEGWKETVLMHGAKHALHETASGVSAAASIVVGDPMEEFEAAPEADVPAAILATGYGRLPQVAPRSLDLFGELDELGPIFARVGGVA